MTIEMAQLERIRLQLHVKELSQRATAKVLGISRTTVAKYANRTEAPRYQRTQPRPKPVLTPEIRAEIERLLAQNETLPRKQRWVSGTIFAELQRQGYQGSEPSVRRHMALVRKVKRKPAAYVPLAYNPGETAEFDWGEVEIVMAGRLIKAQIGCYRLRWSHMPFVLGYPHQRQEAMFDCLRRAFECTGGVPGRLTTDNLTQAVQQILEGKERKEQEAYLSFRTHYLFDSNFCNPSSGNEKGSVENLVGFAQRQIVGPRPEFDTWEQFDQYLWEGCLDYAKRKFRGETQTVQERWQQEQRVLRTLPNRPFDCAKTVPVTSNSLSCVQFDTCRYSVPVRYVGQTLLLRAYWDHLEIFAGLQKIAQHPRCFARDQDVLDLDHYLELLLKKPGALSQARPFQAAALAPIYHQFRAVLNQQDPRHGDREFVQILLLHREFPAAQVQVMLEQASSQGTFRLEAVRQLLGCHHPERVEPSSQRPELPTITVQQPSLRLYDSLLRGTEGGAAH